MCYSLHGLYISCVKSIGVKKYCSFNIAESWVSLLILFLELVGNVIIIKLINQISVFAAVDFDILNIINC